ncbi:MAG TPA: two-component regulator propeller domain-containing protein [Pseudoduganella sp.]
MHLRCLSAFLSFAVSAACAAPLPRFADYHHTSWTTQDGAPTEIKAMAQTPDGWLWLATPTGLYRFDGVRFSRYVLTSKAYALARLYELVARPNGELWIGDMVGGLFVLRPDGKLEDVSPDGDLGGSTGGVHTIAFARDDSVWIATPTGLFRRAGGKWTKIGEEAGIPPGYISGVICDQYGRIWVASPAGVFRFDAGSGRFVSLGMANVDGRLIMSPDGRVWLSERDRLRRVPDQPPGGLLPRPAYFNQSEARAFSQFDRAGNLWAATGHQGAVLVAADTLKPELRLQDSAADRLDQRWQLSSLTVNGVLEDREGNLWMATQSGLDRFRRKRLIRPDIPEGSGMYTMASGDGGRVWIADPEAKRAWRLGPDGEVEGSEATGLVANDRDGGLLLVWPREIERRYRGKVSRITLPPGRDGKPVDLDLVGVLDDGKVLWIASLQTGLMGYVNGEWLPRSRFNLPDKIFLSTRGGPGQLWLACGDGSLVLYDDGKLTRYDAAMIGVATVLRAGAEVLAAGAKGVAVLQEGRLRPLVTADPEVLLNVSGIDVTADGDYWLNGGKGIVHVRAADWQAAMRDPARPLRYELLDSADGYPGRAMLDNRLPSIFKAPNGRLWFMTTGGVVHLDPGRLERNAVVPHVQIEGLNAGSIQFSPRAPVTLPAGVQGFQVQYTSTSLRKPEGVQFRYQLEGADAGWQEGAGQRAVHYNNLEPGTYRFRVAAANEDGVPGEREATLAVTVTPTLTQSMWFRVLAVLAAAGLLYLVYRYRLRVATARVEERMQVRLAERERIARALHDTFLQSLQAIVLRVHTVATELPAGGAARRKLEQLLDYADKTLELGRDQVQELRNGPQGGLAQVLEETGRALAEHSPGSMFALTVEGLSRPLLPQAEEEACNIAQEAVRNAFNHAGPCAVTLLLCFGPEQLLIEVADDGAGFIPVPKEGRWGLVGMRERAERIGASLDIDSAPGAGTRVTLRVPAQQAYPG